MTTRDVTLSVPSERSDAERENKTPPNLRDGICCSTCKHYSYEICGCTKYMHCYSDRSHICDDYISETSSENETAEVSDETNS